MWIPYRQQDRTKTMDIRTIKTEADYEAALQTIDQLMDAELGTPEGDQLDVLVTLVEAYEAKHYPIADPDPIAAIVHRISTRTEIPACFYWVSRWYYWTWLDKTYVRVLRSSGLDSQGA